MKLNGSKIQGPSLTPKEKYIDETAVELVGTLCDAMREVAASILPPGAAPNQDAYGGEVRSLTEAMMGCCGGLCRIADAINNLAEAVRETRADHDSG